MKSVLFLLALVAFSSTVQAECLQDSHGKVVCGAGECLQDKYGAVTCAKTQGAGCASDRYGSISCSEAPSGGCTTDRYGNVECSKKPSGSCITDQEGKVVCGGGKDVSKTSGSSDALQSTADKSCTENCNR